jgi:hypothetical protein
MNEAERRRFEQLRADQRMLDRAAARIRHEGFQGQYAGFHRKEIAFGVAAVFDMLALQIRQLPDGVRAQAVAAAVSIFAAPLAPAGGAGGSSGPKAAARRATEPG